MAKKWIKADNDDAQKGVDEYMSSKGSTDKGAIEADEKIGAMDKDLAKSRGEVEGFKKSLKKKSPLYTNPRSPD